MLELQVLGPISVHVGGATTAVGSRTHRALLAGLAAARGRAVPVDALADLVWDDRRPPSAARSLKSHLSRLRRTLGEDVVAARPPGYALTIDADQLDLHRFEQGVSRAATVDALDEALSLWRGQPYGDLADHPHLAADVARLTELYLHGRLRRAHLLLASGRPADAVADCAGLVEEDAWREPAWIGLMLALRAAGRQADATSAARRYRRAVAAVGLDPSPDFVDAERQVYAEAPPADRAPVTALPMRTSSIVGRQREIDRFADLLRSRRLLSLVGAGGVGKTTLAVEVARDLAGEFPDGRWLATLTDVEDPAGVVAAVCRAVGAPLRQPLLGALADYLRPRQALVVLDNAEHVHGAVRQVAAHLLATTADVHLLTTSRQPLGIPGELVVTVEPLAVDDAMALFSERATEAGASIEGHERATAELCTALDRLPLSIEMAAARLRGLSVPDLAAQLQKRLHLLRSTEPGRHATLAKVVAWSYDLLEDQQQQAFVQLSVFAGPFDLAAAEAVCTTDDVAEVLADLVDRSLVVANVHGASATYRLLHVVRSFAAEQLATADPAGKASTRFVRHHVRRADQIAAGLQGADEPSWAERFDEQTPNLEAALARSLEIGDLESAVRIAAPTYHLVYQRLRADVGTWAERTAPLARAADHPAWPEVAAAAAMNLLNRDDADGVVTLLSGLPDDPASRHAHEVLGELCVYRGDLDQALVHLSAAERLARAVDDEFTATYSRISRAIGMGYLDRVEEGLALVDELRTATATARNPLLLAWCDYTRGELLAETRPQPALAFVDKAVAAADDAGWRMLAGAGRLTASSLRARAADPVDAVPGFERLIRHWARLGDRTHQWTTLRNLVELLVRIEAHEPAAELIGALSNASIPSYGAEQARLREAADAVRSHLGTRAEQLMATGRGHDLAAAVQLSLAALASRASAPAFP